MTITKDSGRQEVISASVPFAFGDLAVTTENVAVIELPQGAVLLSGVIVIDTAFNSGTSDVLEVGDATDPNRYVGSVDAQAEALTALVPTGYVMTAPTDITITNTIVGAAATAGAGRLLVTYVVDGRAAFSQG